MACKYELKRKKSRAFLAEVSDASLLFRRKQHEQELKEDLDGRPSYPIGSLSRGKRLIWMREVRTQIRERRLGT